MRASVHDLKRAMGILADGAQHPLLFRFLDTTGDGTGTKLFTASHISEAAFIAPAAGERFRLTRLLVTIHDASAVPEVYGGLAAALTNGIQIKQKRAGTTVVDFTDGLPIKNNANWIRLAGVDVVDLDWGNVTNDHVVGVRWTFDKAGQEILLDGDASDTFEVELNDNFTGLIDHTFMVQGYKLK
jgi:hypothetical protein